MQRLGVVIPYRDRQQHLMQLVPHLGMYFTRDKVDKALNVRIFVVEQPPGTPFNRGLLCNLGFKLLHNEIDYVCFHDVDYLPMWAEYSYPSQPTMIVWDGFHARPIDPADPNKGQTIHNPADSFSAVVLLTVEQFERANGFPTTYWGWGFEDTDLRRRLELLGYRIEHRKGTFHALNHRSNGFLAHSKPSADNLRNGALLQSRWTKGDEWQSDGLNSTTVQVINRLGLTLPPHARVDIRAERVLVNVGQPTELGGVIQATAP
jgi:N-terminal region of glycosyl transferase group 7/N-terminal domain of galactosyltransferase